MQILIFLWMLCLMVACSAFAGGQAASVIKAVRVTPLQFNAATGLTVEPVLIDSNAYYTFEYRWFLNGEELLTENTASLSGALVKRDDTVAVEVTPIDDGGEMLVPFFGLPLKAVNVSPTIHSLPPETFGNRSFSYQVQASDLDGDTLNYRLENSLDGMNIDRASGLLSWNYETMPVGVFSVLIVVEDGHGGRAEQAFELNLSYGSKGAVNE